MRIKLNSEQLPYYPKMVSLYGKFIPYTIFRFEIDSFVAVVSDLFADIFDMVIQ